MVIIKVKKSYAELKLDVDIRFGEEIAILTGPNGGGKSTLLKIIAGLTEPDSGLITVMGHIFNDDNTHAKPEERSIGYVPQGDSLFPWLSVHENILFALPKEQRTKHSEVKLQWIEELTDNLNLGHLLRRYPRHLSGGEIQRVALARALAPKPSMLLLDEPLSAIDVDMRPKFRKFIQDTQNKWKVPVLMVSHDHAEASIMGDRIFTLEQGVVTSKRQRGSLKDNPLVSY